MYFSIGKKKRKTRQCDEEETEEPEQKAPEEELAPEDLKKKEDDLWAMFLDGTDTKPKPKEPSKEPPKAVAVKKVEVKKVDTSDRDKRIFEFAGETIVVENNVIKERIKTEDSPSTGKITGKLEKLIFMNHILGGLDLRHCSTNGLRLPSGGPAATTVPETNIK